MKKIIKKFLLRCSYILSDKLFLELKFYIKMREKLDLKNPKTFNEKLQWLKLYDRKPIYTTMVDKYEVKKYVSDLIGEEYIIPTLGVWDCFDDIDFDKLPEQFVLKCTHDSGGVFICRSKSEFDIKSVKKEIESSLKNNYFYSGREWPYKNIKPRIIAEEFISDDGHVPVDYKIYCFNGEPYKTMMCLDRDKDEPTKFYSFDTEWNLLRHNKWGKEAPENFTLPVPGNIDDMYKFARIFSDDISFLRVDFYEVNGRLYFGELTFYPDSGFDSAILPEIDQLYGEMININL